MKLQSPNFNVVLIEPEIPNNTGSIGRTCVGTQSSLHLVGKLGFDLDEKAVRRAGLDYWEYVDLVQHVDTDQFRNSVPNPQRVFYFTKKAKRSFFEVSYQKGDWFVFGKETAGLDDELLRQVEEQTVRIPQWGPIRSLNLSNAVSVVLYEGMRQIIASSSNSQ